MSETIYVQFTDVVGDGNTYTAFLHSVAGALLNTGGDALGSPTGPVFPFTLAETRVANAHYLVSIYEGTTEDPANLVFEGMLFPGQTLVDFDGNLANLTVPYGTVASGAATATFTAATLVPGGAVADQFQGRVIVFDNDTTTPELRGQATIIESNTAAALPLFVVTALTTAPAAGDKFRIT